jgi:periplasmic divalent cation tolerance protein
MTAEVEFIIVLVAAANPAEAAKISRALLEAKLAACINTLSGISSSYWWHGKIENAEESLLIIKTRKSLLDDIVATVKKLHSYEVPEIIALPVIGGSPDYLKWLDETINKSVA